jgi:hypothetical protein
VKTVIYLDELLLVNFAAGAALLLAAGLAAGRGCSPLRLLAGAGVAALAALLLLAPELPFAAALVAKAAAAALAVRLAYGRQGRWGFARLYLWYFVLSLALTGAVTALALRRPQAGAQSANLAVYLDLSPGVLLLCVGGVYGLLRAAARLFGAARAVCVPAQLVLQGREIPVQAFYDTGFALEDPAGQRAAVLVRYPAVRAALPEALCLYLDSALGPPQADGSLPVPDAALRVRFVLCGTVAGQRLLPAVPAESLRRSAQGRTWHKEGILAVFCAGEAAEADAPWSLLLGSDLAGLLGLDAPL